MCIRDRHDDDVVRRDHAEVAVPGFGRMYEERGRARRCERRRELPRNVPGLADAGYDDASLAAKHQLECRDEWRAEPLPERRDRARFGIEHVAGERNSALCVDGSDWGVARVDAHVRLGGHRAKYT